jgi:WD40-like Beta Propeller Repeat
MTRRVWFGWPIPLLALMTSNGPARGEPELFAAGSISTGDMELNAAFTPDQQTIYFTKRAPKPQLWVIVVSHLRAGRWTEPEVASFSGQYNDFDPFVSPDGLRLYFSSNRPVDGRAHDDFDLWVVERAADGWSEPKRLDSPVNSPDQEFYPTVSADGTLYFSSTRGGGLGSGDIYRSTIVDGKYTQPENLGEAINTKSFEGDPYIAPDQSYLLFVSYNRVGGLGDGDIYISHRAADGWTPAENLGPGVNSKALDFCPIVSPDGKFLFFTSERGFADEPQQRRLGYSELVARIRGPGNGLGDIYRVDRSTLFKAR